MGCVVVFCTVYALILPALTMEGTAYCGQEEHVHTDACYTAGETSYEKEQICSVTGVAHTHTDICYDSKGVLVCTLEEVETHTHTGTCYEEVPLETVSEETTGQDNENENVSDETESSATETVTERKLICDKLELSEHVHSEVCFETVEAIGARTLACQETEHTHTKACYANPKADVETEAVWEKTLEDVTLTGDYAVDVLAIATSQLGYTESSANYIMEGETQQGYTRYGAWYGVPYGEWCAMYVSFCLNYAEVEGMPLEAGCQNWINKLQSEEYDLYVDLSDEENADYIPQSGDLIFFNLDSEPDSDHVGIVTEYIAETEENVAVVKTIEGNSYYKVRLDEYEADDASIMGYGKLPEQIFYCGNVGHVHTEECYDSAKEFVCETEEHIHTNECESISEIQGEANVSAESANEMIFTYEEGEISLQVQVTSEEGLPTDMEMSVSELETESEEYTQLEEFALENSEGELLNLLAYQLSFQSAGAQVELSNAEVVANLTVLPKNISEEEIAAINLEEAEEAEEEDNIQAKRQTMSVLQLAEDEVTVVEKVELSESETAELVLNNAQVFAVSRNAISTEFTVEYYANIPRYVIGTEAPNQAYITVIDTTGKKLPQNGKGRDATPNGNPLKYLYLKESGYSNQNHGDAQTTAYEIDTTTELTEIYKSIPTEYFSGMAVTHLDCLRENSHYQLENIQISVDKGASWKTYGIDIEFTNNEASQTDKVIYIPDGATVRYIYKPTNATYSNSVNFFDYDISDTMQYVYSGIELKELKAQAQTRADVLKIAGGTATWMRTDAQGINSASNYSTAGVHLAFGNGNTGTTLGDLKWNGNLLNRYNKPSTDETASFNGCTFGIVSGYDMNTDKLTYSAGIAHPDLFNYEERTVTGKTTYTGNTLDFKRVGDTYTLTSVNGGASGSITEEDLEKFFVPTEGEQHTSRKLILTNNFWPLDGTTDDSKAGHDMKFGETPAENRNYVNGDGKTKNTLPLSDDHNNHNSYFGLQYAVKFQLDGSYKGPLEYYFYGDDDMWVFLDGTLICDIGGVHSSVGTYVNLWDYISESTTGTHTLTFFYTERGASGSSCYMSFTLPRISSITQNTQNTGSIAVEKKLEQGKESDQKFRFKLTLDDDDLFPYTIYHASSSTSGTIKNGGEFSLKAGEHIVISGIPHGKKYTVTELTTEGYETKWKVGETETNGSSVAGEIPQANTLQLVCTNTPLANLTLTKHVNGEMGDETKEFAFEMMLHDKAGNPINGSYSYAQGEKVGELTFTNGKAIVKLKKDENILIKYLPIGATWSIVETTTEGYLVGYNLNGTVVEENAGGTISVGENIEVIVTNTVTYQLPETGGIGTTLFMIGGLALMSVAGILLYNKSHRREGKAS